MPSDLQRVVLDRLARGPATLAALRAAFPPDSAEARALMSMGEDDPFAAEVLELVRRGEVDEADGRYRLREGASGAS